MKLKHFSRKYIFVLICIFLFVLLFYLIVEGYSDLNKYKKVYSFNTIDVIDQRLNSLYAEVENFPRSTVNDVLFLAKLSSLNALTNSIDSASENEAIKNVEKDMLSFLEENSAYYQIRYFNREGKEVVNVKYDKEERRIIPPEDSQSEEDKYYFEKTISLQEEEVFISSLDLNKEHGEIENRGSKENPVYVPVIRYATPVFDEQNNRKGIIISSVYADYFLEDIKKFQREGEVALLVNSEGYYLSHPDKSKEFAFMFGRDDKFYNDYPEIPQEILSDFNERNQEMGNLIFSFRRIFPTVGSFEAYKGSRKIFGEDFEKSHFWVLVVISETDFINTASRNLVNDYLFFLIFSGVIILIVVILAFLLVFFPTTHREYKNK